MACDITIRVEYQPKLDQIRFDDRWLCGDLFKLTEKPERKNEFDFEVVPIYEGRNYALFGALAGVRSVWLAPIRTGGEFPEDACEEIKLEYEEEKESVFSPSYATLREIIDFNKMQIFLTEEDEKEMTQEYDASMGLHFLTRQLIERAKLLYWNDFNKKGRVEDYYGEHIRIVFWFDN